MTEKNTSQAAPPVAGTIRAAKSLNPEIRKMLLECPSHHAFFQRVLDICFDTFGPVTGRVDFRVGQDLQSASRASDRIASSLARRFDEEYVVPFSMSVLEESQPEAQLKQYERGDQKMTLISAPVMHIAEEKVAGVVTLMLTGDNVRPDVILPRLDGIVSVASAVMLLKTRPKEQPRAAAATQPGSPTDTQGASTQPNGAAREANPSQTTSTAPTAPMAPTVATDAALAQNSALAKTAKFKSTREFGYSVVNSLNAQTGAEQTSFGVVKNDRVIVEAISSFSDFKASSPGVQTIRQAMEECLDHGSFTIAQQQDIEGINVLPIHRQWSAENRNSCICSIPLRDGNRISGIISIRRPADRPFSKEEVAKLLQTLTPYGSAIDVIDKANRPVTAQMRTAVADATRQNLSKGSNGRKVFLACLLLGIGWFFFGSIMYRPICRTRVTASDMRHFSAPFNGKLRHVHVRPGAKVKQGDVLAEFDTVDLTLQLNSLEREIASAQIELRQAISANELEAAALANARVNVLLTQAQAVQKQIDDARIVAPIDGIVVLSDLEQRIGQVFPQGEEILQLAPEGDWMLEIEIPDDIISYVATDRPGTFIAASQPTDSQAFTIKHVDGAAEMVDDRNVFIATAPLNNQPDWMLTGMEGTSRIETVHRPVWWVAMHRVVDWARMNFWL